MPRHAIPHAVAQMRAMTLHSRAAAVANPAFNLTGSWLSLGPVPMSEKANFTGVTFGSNAPMTGRITSVAADATGLIVAGAASGGLWVSTDNGTTFTSVFDAQPTQSIGAIALDTTTIPSTIYVGTGEGNDSFDSLYGAGIFESTNLGSSWTQLASSTFDHTAFSSLAIDTSTLPPHLFAGTITGFSSSRGEGTVAESDSTKSGLWMSANGGTSWTHLMESNFGNCDLVGDGTAPCPVDDVKIDPLNPQLVYVNVDGQGNAASGFGLYRSTNGGTSFSPVSLPGNPSQGRMSIALGPKVGAPTGPSNPAGGAVYVMVGDEAGGGFSGFFVSFDAGVTWNPGNISTPTVPSFSANNVTIDGMSDSNFTQSFFDQALLVNPDDASTV